MQNSGAAVAAFGAQNELQISASVKLTAHPYIALAAALVFRIFGIRLLRYLNGVSCLNRGITDIAKREFSLIHCVNKVPKTYSKCPNIAAERITRPTVIRKASTMES